MLHAARWLCAAFGILHGHTDIVGEQFMLSVADYAFHVVKSQCPPM
jgi:hypothetical protein